MCFYFQLSSGCVQSFISVVHVLWNMDGFSISVLWIKNMLFVRLYMLTLEYHSVSKVLKGYSTNVCVGKIPVILETVFKGHEVQKHAFQVSHWLLYYILRKTSFFVPASVILLSFITVEIIPFFCLCVCVVPHFALLDNHAWMLFCGLWRKNKTVLPFETMWYRWVIENIRPTVKGQITE